MSDSPFNIDLQDIKDAATKGGTEIMEMLAKRVFVSTLITVPQIVTMAAALPNEFWLLASSMAAGALQAGPTAFGGDVLKQRVWNMAVSAGIVGGGRAMGALSDADKQAFGERAREAAKNAAVTHAAAFECFSVEGTAHPVVARDAGGNPLCTCTVFDAAARNWRDAHPTHRPPAARGGAPVVVPVVPLPFVPLGFAQVVALRVPQCPCLSANPIAPSKPAEPPKAKRFEEGLTDAELDAYVALRDAAMAQGAHGTALVEAAKRDEYTKVRPVVMRLIRRVVTGQNPAVLVSSFINELEGAYQISPRDMVEHGARAAMSAGARNAGGMRGVVSGLVGHVRHALGSVWDQVKGPAAFTLAIYGAITFLAFLAWLTGVVYSSFGLALVGFVILAGCWVALIPVQKTVDWVMDQGRIVGKRLGFDVDPRTNSIEWLFKLGRDVGVWVLFFGAWTTAMVHMSWPMWIRLAVVLGSLMPVAGAIQAAGRVDLTEKVKKTDKINYAILGVSGAAIVLVEIADRCFGWFNWLKNPGVMTTGGASFSMGLGSWPWWGWFAVGLACVMSAVFLTTFLTPKRGEPDEHRTLRAAVVLITILLVVGCTALGINGFLNKDAAPSSSHQAATPTTVVVNVIPTTSASQPQASSPPPAPAPAPPKASASAPPKVRHTGGTRMYSDEECRRKTRTSLGYATCQGQKW